MRSSPAPIGWCHPEAMVLNGSQPAILVVGVQDVSSGCCCCIYRYHSTFILLRRRLFDCSDFFLTENEIFLFVPPCAAGVFLPCGPGVCRGPPWGRFHRFVCGPTQDCWYGKSSLSVCFVVIGHEIGCLFFFSHSPSVATSYYISSPAFSPLSTPPHSLSLFFFRKCS